MSPSVCVESCMHVTRTSVQQIPNRARHAKITEVTVFELVQHQRFRSRIACASFKHPCHLCLSYCREQNNRYCQNWQGVEALVLMS